MNKISACLVVLVSMLLINVANCYCAPHGYSNRYAVDKKTAENSEQAPSIVITPDPDRVTVVSANFAPIDVMTPEAGFRVVGVTVKKEHEQFVQQLMPWASADQIFCLGVALGAFAGVSCMTIAIMLERRKQTKG